MLLQRLTAEYGEIEYGELPAAYYPLPQRISHGAAAKQIVDQVVDSSLLKRYGTLDEQAAAITFLASDEASYITGTVLPVAGGDLG